MAGVRVLILSGFMLLLAAGWWQGRPGPGRV